MAIYKRGNIWWIRFTAPDGKLIRQSTGTINKAQAQEYHDRMKTRYWEQYKLGVKPERNWREAVVMWLKETGHKATHDQDIWILQQLHPFLGDLTLCQITREVIQEVEESKRRQGYTVQANRYLGLIRAILRRARDEWEWIDRIPKIRLYPEAKKRIRWITRGQADQLLACLPAHLADLAAFTLATGLRRSNATYLRWDQVNMDNQIAWIHPDEAKSRKAIGVPLNEDALNVLRRRLGKHAVYVFTWRDKPVYCCTTKAWKKGLHKAGIENFRWHDLRHTWASWHVQNGTTLQELMELGGWSSFQMVLRYAHLATDHLKTAANRITSTNLAQSNQDNVIRLTASR